MDSLSMDEKIKRINELYHKSQGAGLTPEEKDEQARLRRDYINNIRANLRSQLNQIDMQNADGSVTNLGEEHAAQAEKPGGSKPAGTEQTFRSAFSADRASGEADRAAGKADQASAGDGQDE